MVAGLGLGAGWLSQMMAIDSGYQGLRNVPGFLRQDGGLRPFKWEAAGLVGQELGWQMGSKLLPKGEEALCLAALLGQVLKGRFLEVPGVCLERSRWPWYSNWVGDRDAEGHV